MARRSKRARKSSTKSRKNKRILNVTKKAAMTAGSLSAIALAPAAAQAAVVTVTGSPVSLSMTSPNLATATWDVDGTDGDDFMLWKAGDSGTGTIFMASMTLPGSAAMRGRGFVGPADY